MQIVWLQHAISNPWNIIKHLTIFQGLEGRSTNTVSLLFDALLHPDADLGINSPSLLEWENMPDLQIDHVVLGKGMCLLQFSTDIF